MGSQHIAYEEFEVAQIDLPILVEIELSLAVMNRAADGVNVRRSPTVARSHHYQTQKVYIRHNILGCILNSVSYTLS